MSGIPKGRNSDKTHRSSVSAADKRAEKLQNKMKPAQLLDPDALRRQQIKDPSAYPIASTFQGQWYRPDKRDTDYKIRQDLIGGNANGATPFGVMTAGEKEIEYLKDKKKQEEYNFQLRLGSMLIDPQRPETQEKAFSIFPQLKEYPDDYHAQNLAVQEALRTMLRDGTVGGQEDIALIAQIVRADYVLPMFPVWDPDGIIIADAVKASGYLQTLGAMYKQGLFNPRKWGLTADDIQTQSEIQRTIKTMILKRLFPGLRAEEANSHAIDQFIAKESNLGGIDANKNVVRKYIGSDPLKLYDWVRGKQGVTTPGDFGN